MRFFTFDGVTEYIRMWDATDALTGVKNVIYIVPETNEAFIMEKETFEHQAKYVSKRQVP